MSDEAVAISGVRRGYREMVDGTLRVVIDIEPQFKKAFLEMFPEIDTPVALAPLGLHVDTTKPKGWHDMGPLTQSAVMLCKEPDFQRWIASIVKHPDAKLKPEEMAADYIRVRCGVASRKELDTIDGGKSRFGALMADYREWLKKNPL